MSEDCSWTMTPIWTNHLISALGIHDEEDDVRLSMLAKVTEPPKAP